MNEARSNNTDTLGDEAIDKVKSRNNESSGAAMWWTAEVDQLLRDWRNRAYAAQTGHYVMTTRLRRWNYLLGVPVVVLTSVIGTSIFANLGNQAPPIWVRIAAGVVSLLAAVLSGLQTFFTFGETASLHSGAAAWYSAIRRDIEGLLALPPERRGDPKTSIESIRKEMNKVGQTAPELNERLWAGLARRFNVKEPPPND